MILKIIKIWIRNFKILDFQRLFHNGVKFFFLLTTKFTKSTHQTSLHSTKMVHESFKCLYIIYYIRFKIEVYDL